MANIDLNQYNNMYGYKIGDLKNADNISESIPKSEKNIFDTSTLNFHFYPSNEQKCKEIEDAISEKIKKIEAVIEKNYGVCKKCELIEKNKAKDKMYFYLQKSGKIHGTSCKLFKYIATVKNDNLYELNFMRFYIDEDNKINCIVKEIQFDRIVGNNNKNLLKETANKHGICYPNTDKHHESLKELIKTNENKNFFYNPPVKFSNSDEDILNAFVDFIETCEGEKF